MTDEKKDLSGSIVHYPSGNVSALNSKALGAVMDVFHWFDAGVPIDFDLYDRQVNTAFRWLKIAAEHGLLDKPEVA